ncbi:transcription antitermination factor NusB [Haloechinothrix sp. LS1_15]|uniref:transcription antitermination factor NusB n=1 Tax=Haloechinothrix sp. LS1_15 TaxID=2652248 RepID=UPI002945C1D4|nr:transcription antitermination factor NusB [Haloechinothrix sp. LS1_15]MDV6013276.1 transcription antitermination factor NusB [Haloechinothrix sp. LS1_15]
MSADSAPKRAPFGRHAARQRAVELFYEAEQRDEDPVSLTAGRVGSPDAEPIADYTISLIEGVGAHRARIDEILAEHSHGWTLDRMPAVDRAVLRIGLYEMLWVADVPDAVAIDEAVGLAKELSTDDSPRFVNGVLGRIATIADRLRAVL